ncbi:hypothetical protein ACWEHA_38735, partial [Amycolatopsis nivea]
MHPTVEAPSPAPPPMHPIIEALSPPPHPDTKLTCGLGVGLYTKFTQWAKTPRHSEKKKKGLATQTKYDFS